MVSQVQSKVSSTAMGVAGNFSPSVPQPAPVASSEKLEPALAPIKKMDIKVDPAEMLKKLTHSINQLNEMMRDGGRNLSFSVDQALHTPIITVRNQDTGEVIRQIPNEVVVKVAHSFEAMKGLLLNAKI